MEKELKFLLYNNESENVYVESLIRDESIRLTQKSIAELFDCNKSSISRHLKNIFDSGELDEKVVVAKIATTTEHGAIPNKIQKINSDFNKFSKKLLEKR